MATKQINTRIALKIDTLAAWGTSNLILKLGEVAFATTAATVNSDKNKTLTEPVIIMKIGDGTHKFKELPNSFYANALDVLSICKDKTAFDNYVDGLITAKKYATADALKAVSDLVGTTAVATQIQNAIEALDLANTYEAKGAADAVKTAVIGSNDDVSTADTIYGAKAYAKAEADKKLASIGEKDASIVIDNTIATTPKIGVQLDNTVGNALELIPDKGLRVEIPTAAEYSIIKDDNSGDYAAVYHLTKDGANIGTAINIPKDMVVQSGSVVTNPQGQPAGTYIELILQNVETPLYINVGDLIEYVTSGSEATDMVVVSVSDDHKVTATLTDGKITLAKLETDVQTKINQAHTHSNKTVLDGIDSTKVGNWDTAYSNTHTHSNKTVLDGVTSDKVTSWDTAATQAGSALQEITTTVNGGLKVTNKNKIDIDDSVTFIFNCGTSTTVTEG